MVCPRPGATALTILWLAVIGVSGAPFARAERLPLRTLTTTDGLVNNVVNRIVGDSRGFVWFCTREGLARFDGHGFTTFGLAEGLPSAVINTLIETRAGDYWIGTGDGLVRLDPQGGSPVDAGEGKRGLFIRYAPGADHRQRSVTSLLERRDGGLWVGTRLGLYSLERDGDTWRFTAEPVLDHAAGINALAEDASGALWMGADDGLYRWRAGASPERWTSARGLPSNRVLSVFVDRRQHVWVGTMQGLVNIRLDRPSEGPSIEHVYTTAELGGGRWVWQVTESWDGTIWVATDGGLARLVRGSASGHGPFRLFDASSGLPSHHVSALAEDRNRNLWVGTRHGAARVLSGGFTIFDGHDGIPTAAALALTRRGDVLVMEAVDQWRVNRYDGQKFAKTTIPMARLTNSWGWNQMYLVDRSGDSWLGTRSGVWRFRGALGVDTGGDTAPVGRYTSSSNGFATDVVLRLFEDSRGDIWIGTAGEGERHNGVSRWERATGTFHHYTERHGLPPLDQFYMSALAEDRSGGVWIGLSGDGGLVRYENGRFRRFTVRDGVPGGSIRNLLVDSAGRLWAASYRAGLIGADSPTAQTPTFWRYSRADGLSSNEVGAVVEDLTGRIYAGTARGIDVVDPATRRVRTYPASDGLPPGEAQAAIRDASGALWFTYLSGVVRLLPDAEQSAAAPQVVITGVRVAGRALRLSQLGDDVVPAVDLPYTENAIDVDFVAPGFGPRDARFQVRLDGAGHDWSQPSEQRSVSFPNVAPGGYRLLIRAVTPTGEPGPSQASFAFAVNPPIWRRWWFLGALALTGVVVGSSLYRVRTVRKRELEALRVRIAGDLHDDIGANLTRIAVLTEVVRKQVGPLSPADGQLNAIAGVARESVASMGDIVWTVNPAFDTLHDLVSKIREHAGDALADREIALTIDAPVLLDASIPGHVRRDVYLVAKEAVTNAARHARCSAVTITLALEGTRLTLTISDDGVGFDPTPHAAGHGLANMQRRAARLQATFAVVSSPGAGARVNLDVPLDGRVRATG